MIRPEFFWISVFVLVVALATRPRNPWARFLVRQIVTMAAIALWGANSGFFLGYWGYEGEFFRVFFWLIAPLIVALHPQKVWVSLPLVACTFLAIAGMTIRQMTTGFSSAEILGSMFEAARFYAWLALPGTFVVWLYCQGGIQKIDRWDRERKARKAR